MANIRAGQSPRLMATLLLLFVADGCRSCTEVQIMSPSGELVVANAIEAGGTGGASLDVTPSLRGGKHGGHQSICASFTNTYGFIAGMNEAGLAINGHALDLAVFQTPQPNMDTICKEDFESWVLGLHATVAEVATHLRNVRVVGSPGGQWGVQDASGQSIVIEYIKGQLHVHNNSVFDDNSGIGMMTNDPTWDWHLQNVNNYAALQPSWYSQNNEGIERVVPGEASYPWATNAYNTDAPRVPQPIGHGYNLLGLPGDGSPPARFIRGFFLRGYALQNAPPKDLNGTLLLGQELLNSVYKTLGTIPGQDPVDPLETTPISTLKVTSNGTKWVLHRSRYDMTWRKIDVARIDFGTDAIKRTARVAMGQFTYVDVTDELLR